MTSPDTPAPDDVPEQIAVRRAKRERLLAAGVAPYPVGVPRTATIAAVRAGHPAVVPALPVTDTVKRVGPGDGTGEPVVETVPRGTLRAVQTPQGFRRDVLVAAHAAAAHRADDESTAASDDAGLVEARGVPVWVVPGDERAVKITTPTDLALAGLLAAQAAATR